MSDEPNNITKLLTAFLTQIQALEDAFQQLLFKRYVDTAEGVQLDKIGKLVGQPRGGLGDDDYRRLIRARIVTNRSSGIAEQLILIARLVVNDPTAYYHLTSEGRATAVLAIEGVVLDYPLAELLMIYLRSAVAAGVRLVLEFSTVPTAASFSFAGGPGLGWGDETDPSKGGRWASALQ